MLLKLVVNWARVFFEKIYENALAHELRKEGHEVKQQFAIRVMYDGVFVGEHIADLLVEVCVLVELKAVKILDPAHVAQCYNYLKATKLKVCLLLNFGRKKWKFGDWLTLFEPIGLYRPLSA